MVSNLHTIVSLAKGREESAVLELLDAFLPQIKNLSHSVSGEDTCQDLQLFLLELADKLPLERDIFQNNRILGAYIARSLRRRAYLLRSQMSRKQCRERALDEDLAAANPLQFEDSVLLFGLLKTLAPKERRLLYWIYFDGYTCAEISRARRVSAQAINQAKRKALQKLRCAYSGAKYKPGMPPYSF